MFYRHKIHYINESLAYYRKYNNQERLSVQSEKYIGIKKKMYVNFKKMNVKYLIVLYLIVLYLIAVKLVKSTIVNANLLSNNKAITVNKFTLYFRPVHYLNEPMKKITNN